jgi:ferredoxin-NADP reductase
MRLTLPVREVIAATPRAVILMLDLGGQLFPYRAGQAVLLGGADQDERRPYSIANAPHEATATDALELLVGLEFDGTPGPHLPELAPGIRVSVDGPMGTFVFPDRPEERRFLFVAGGTGIAPLRAMLHEALARNIAESISVVYSARTADDFAYGPELRALAAAGRLTLWQTVTRDAGAQWDGALGRIAVGHLRSMIHDRATLCFVCGPHALVHEVAPLLEQLGVSPERVRAEDWES